MARPTFLDPLAEDVEGPLELFNAGRGTVLASQIDAAFDSASRKRGLLGRDIIPDDYALVIAPCASIHTFFMRCPIDAIFVARDGTVTGLRRHLQPWRAAVSWRAYAVIEGAPGLIDHSETESGDVVLFRRASVLAPLAEALPAGDSWTAPADTIERGRARTTRITLADLVSHRTPVAWYEAVAIVQELCKVVLAQQVDHEERVPELTHVALASDGDVQLLGRGPAARWSVHRAGAVLLALVPEDQLPVHLRLLVLEEVSPAPRFKSLVDLSRELEFYERPDRRDIVRGVVERHVAMAAKRPAADTVPAPLLERPASVHPKLAWWKHRRARAAGILAILAALMLGIAWEWRRPSGQWLRGGVAAASESARVAAVVARSWLAKGVEAFRQRAGLVARPGTPASPLAAADSGRDGASRPGNPRSLPPRAIAVTPVREPTPDATGALTPSDISQSGAWEAAGWATGTPVPAELQDVTSATQIYTPSHTIVTPPELVRPALTQGVPPGVNDSDLPEVELIISVTGEVESAKFTTMASGAKSAMMLNAVRAWLFQPARLDGNPVRYRLRVKLIG